MIRFVFAAVFCGLAALAVPAAASAPPTFHDPAMSFTAPDGYTALTVPKYDPANVGEPTVVAAYTKDAGKPDARSINIQMESFDGSLSGFDVYAANELREQIDGVFISNKKLTTLSNGMPAYWETVTIGEGFNEFKRYEYLWVDGVRGVVLSVIGRYGEITEAAAKKSLASASAVAFPRNGY